MLKRSVTILVGSWLLAAPAARAGLVNLGTANNYNVFVLGNDTQAGPDSQGRVAVGGNANFNGGYTVGSQEPAGTSGSAPSLVVGGNFSISSNTIDGNAVIGGNATISDPTINGNLAVNGSLSIGGGGTVNGNITYGSLAGSVGSTVSGTVSQGSTALPINFSAEQAYLTSLSQSLANASTYYTYGNGVTFQYGGFTLTGTNSKIDVFDIKGSDLASANSFSITAPSGATVVVNVSGTTDTMGNFGFSEQGVDNQHVLFNFSQATSLTSNNLSIAGSVLAPLASFNFNGGNINGTIVANSISGSGEAHNQAFLGDLSPLVANFSPSSVVPEPSSVLSTLAGLGLVGLFARARRPA